MTQIAEISLAPENYLEYERLLYTYGRAVAEAYASLVTSPKYLSRKPLTLPRLGRRTRR